MAQSCRLCNSVPLTPGRAHRRSCHCEQTLSSVSLVLALSWHKEQLFWHSMFITTSRRTQNASSSLLGNRFQPCLWLQFLIKKQESWFAYCDLPGICMNSRTLFLLLRSNITRSLIRRNWSLLGSPCVGWDLEEWGLAKQCSTLSSATSQVHYPWLCSFPASFTLRAPA
jgi:hypothetical protein